MLRAFLLVSGLTETLFPLGSLVAGLTGSPDWLMFPGVGVRCVGGLAAEMWALGALCAMGIPCILAWLNPSSKHSLLALGSTLYHWGMVAIMVRALQTGDVGPGPRIEGAPKLTDAQTAQATLTIHAIYGIWGAAYLLLWKPRASNERKKQ